MNEGRGCIREAKKIGAVKVMKVCGDLTVDKTSEFHGMCETVRKEDGVRSVLLDFGDVGAIDTAAFACMINFMKEYIRGGARAGIINLDIKDRNLLDILGINGMISVYGDESEALEDLSS